MQFSLPILTLLNNTLKYILDYRVEPVERVYPLPNLRNLVSYCGIMSWTQSAQNSHELIRARTLLSALALGLSNGRKDVEMYLYITLWLRVKRGTICWSLRDCVCSRRVRRLSILLQQPRSPLSSVSSWRRPARALRTASFMSVAESAGMALSF